MLLIQLRIQIKGNKAPKKKNKNKKNLYFRFEFKKDVQQTLKIKH